MPYLRCKKRAFSISYAVVFGFGAKIFLPLRRVYEVFFTDYILYTIFLEYL